jgi:hypothetical protein
MRDFQLGDHIHLIGVSQTGRVELATSFDFDESTDAKGVFTELVRGAQEHLAADH